eukprot:g1600.t1
MEWKRQSKNFNSFQDNRFTKSKLRGHRRHSLLVLEGNSSPSLSTLLNETQSFFPVPHMQWRDPKQSTTIHTTQRTPLVHGQRTHHEDSSSLLLTPPSLMDDISRCQDQVEELIQLFTVMMRNQHKIDHIQSPSIPPIDKFIELSEAKIPKLKCAGNGVQDRGCLVNKGVESVQDLENARFNLKQSLEDALCALDRFPWSDRCSIQSQNEPCGSQENTQQLFIKHPLNRHISSQHEASDITTMPLSLTRNNLINESEISHTFQTNQCDELRQISKLETIPPMTNERPDTCQMDSESANEELGQLCPTYRVLFQEPIHYEEELLTTSQCSSQNLTGMESSLTSRLRPRIERDALSEFNGNQSIDNKLEAQNLNLTRRTKSAASVLNRSDADRVISETTDKLIMMTETSVGASSDWDLVEGGISVHGRPTSSPLIIQPLHWRDPLWTLSSARYTRDQISQTGHQNRRDPSHVSLLSEELSNLEVPHNICGKIDQSVQCDLFRGRSEKKLRIIEASGCVPSLFRRRKQQSNKKSSLAQMVISASFLSHAMSEARHPSMQISGKNGTLCGIRTAMKQAFCPPRPPKRDN